MEPGQVDLDEVLRVCHEWTRCLITRFPRWEFDDVVHEAFLNAVRMTTRFDPAKGTLKWYLWTRLYDPVFRRYCRLHGIKVTRPKKGKQLGKRSYRQLEQNVIRMPDVVWEPPRTDLVVTIPNVTSSERTVISLLSKGHSQLQISQWVGVSQSRISQLVKSIRRKITVRYSV